MNSADPTEPTQFGMFCPLHDTHDACADDVCPATIAALLSSKSPNLFFNS